MQTKESHDERVARELAQKVEAYFAKLSTVQRLNAASLDGAARIICATFNSLRADYRAQLVAKVETMPVGIYSLDGDYLRRDDVLAAIKGE